MANKLEVWLFSQHVGTLTVIEGRPSFCYSREWLARTDAIALSCSLPLQPEPFDDGSTRPFFAGLLPEGHLRELIAKRLQISRQNDTALLGEIGGECAGAVTFLKPGDTPPTAQAREVHWLDEQELANLLEQLPQRPMLAGEKGLRLSLAGAQDKLPVIVEGKRIGLPLNGTPSSHILKPPIRGVEDSVINEGFCLALAKAMQLNVARSNIQQIHDKPFLLVERYDRVPDAQGILRRIHQEDFCQALGIAPEWKYQNEGGPDLAQCFDLVRRVTQPSAPHVLQLLDYVIFNALIGNNDAHAKNFSLLYTDKGLILAPLYDALSTAVYPNLAPKMAMKLDSKYRFSDVQMRHWDRFAQQAAGLSVAQARKRIITLAHQLPLVARKLVENSGEVFGARPLLVANIIQLIEQRSALTIRRLKTC